MELILKQSGFSSEFWSESIATLSLTCQFTRYLPPLPFLLHHSCQLQGRLLEADVWRAVWAHGGIWWMWHHPSILHHRTHPGFQTPGFPQETDSATVSSTPSVQGYLDLPTGASGWCLMPAGILSPAHCITEVNKKIPGIQLPTR